MDKFLNPPNLGTGRPSALLPDVFSPDELAGFLRIPLADVLAAIRAGEIPAGEIAGRTLINRDEFLAALARRRPHTSGGAR